jgi:hypothetical protein
MAWSPPAADRDWTPPAADRDDAADVTTPSDDDSPEAAEAKAAISGGDLLGSVARGIAGQTYGALAMGGKALTNALGVTSGDPIEQYRAGAASVPSEPLTQGGAAAAGALDRGMAAADRPIERAEDYIDPTGNLKATAQDVAERGNAVAALTGVVPGVGAVVDAAGAARGALRARSAVKTATEASAAAEAAPAAAAKAHLEAKGVPVNGVPVEGAPGKSVPATSQQLNQGYNRAVLAHVGETGETAHDPLATLPAARERIVGVMDDVGARTNPQLDTQAAGDIQRVQRTIPGRMSDEAAAPIHHNIETLIDAAAKNDGHIPGPLLQEVNTNLRSLEANPALAETASDMHEALGDLVGRHAAPGDVEALATARNQYRALKQIEGSINTTTGDIDPKKLMTKLSAKKNRNQSLYGAGDQGLMQTARAGARVLPDMHNALADAKSGQLSTADRVRVKLANLVEGGTLGLVGAHTGGLGGVAAAVGIEGSGLGGRLRAGVVHATGGSSAAAAVARGDSPLGARVAGGKMRGAVGDLKPPKAAAAPAANPGDVTARHWTRVGIDPSTGEVSDRAAYGKAKADYAAHRDTAGGKIISADTARDLSPDYNASKESRGTLAAAVHEPSSAFVKQLYKDKLAEPVPAGQERRVLFTAGGTGVGKTSAISDVPALAALRDRAHVVYDTNMNGLESSRQKVQQALAADHAVDIVYVERDPYDAFRNGALPRAERQGRTVPIQAHIDTHSGAYPTVRALEREHSADGRVNVIRLDNSHGKGNARVVPSLDAFAKNNHNPDAATLRRIAKDQLDAGTISRRTYDGTTQDVPVRGPALRAAPEGQAAVPVPGLPEGAGGQGPVGPADGGRYGGQPEPPQHGVTGNPQGAGGAGGAGHAGLEGQAPARVGPLGERVFGGKQRGAVGNHSGAFSRANSDITARNQRDENQNERAA